jgi:acetoin utilization deacetylase AcuC-like enzyme/GNAT superfamily N-acetyltransferase
MLRIRRVPDDLTPTNAAAVAQAQAILRQQFPLARESEFTSIPDQLRDPFKKRLQTLLFVAEDAEDRVKGLALLMHAPDLHFVYLDYLAAHPGRAGSGIGAALYERVRETAAELDAIGVFLECLPDDPALCRDPDVLKQNADRLRFYERFGARPIIGTTYEMPIEPGADNPPYLVFDGLGHETPLRRREAQAIVRALLDRKYRELCPPGYIEMVVASFTDDPVQLRPLRYLRGEPKAKVEPLRRTGEQIPLVINDRHDIHHVKDRGYVEAPVRIASILREVEQAAPFVRMPPKVFAEQHIRAVHAGGFVDFLRKACAQVPPGKSVYPYVFPIRNPQRPPKDVPLRAGYYCIDTFTPLNANAWLAARRAVDCTLTAAERVLEGARVAYALVRPPGHHAERRAFGGFCYFNNAAVAAHYLSRYGRVAVLDIDYHHGNGTQDIFWGRDDVLTVSIHGHPSFAYPYFSGFREETGEGRGEGFNLNLPLAENADAETYRSTLATALNRVRRFRPAYLVLSLGFDTAAGDPTGSWRNRPADFRRIGETIGAQGYPTVVVQEGGYRTRTLGSNARSFFSGLWHAMTAQPPMPQRQLSFRRPPPAPPRQTARD